MNDNSTTGSTTSDENCCKSCGARPLSVWYDLGWGPLCYGCYLKHADEKRDSGDKGNES